MRGVDEGKPPLLVASSECTLPVRESGLTKLSNALLPLGMPDTGAVLTAAVTVVALILELQFSRLSKPFDVIVAAAAAAGYGVDVFAGGDSV